MTTQDSGPLKQALTQVRLINKIAEEPFSTVPPREQTMIAAMLAVLNALIPAVELTISIHGRVDGNERDIRNLSERLQRTEQNTGNLLQHTGNRLDGQERNIDLFAERLRNAERQLEEMAEHQLGERTTVHGELELDERTARAGAPLERALDANRRLQAVSDNLQRERDTGEWRAKLRADFDSEIVRMSKRYEQQIERIGDAHWAGVESYRKANPTNAQQLPPTRSQLVTWLLARLEDANAALDVSKALGLRMEEMHREELGRHQVTQGQLDKSRSACADQAVQIMELRAKISENPQDTLRGTVKFPGDNDPDAPCR